MPRLILAVLVLLAQAAAAGSAHAQEAARSGAAVEFFVERSGGGYEVVVSPRFVTVFYLPEKAIRALGSNQKDFGITILRDTVVVRPLKDEPGLTANLNIDMKSLRISVVMKVGKPEEAVAQVIFTRAKEKAEIDRKVEAAVAPLRSELEKRAQSFADEVRAAADEAIADAMARSFVVQDVNTVTRDDDGVVLRVSRVVRVGDSLYVQFSIQNRSGKAYLLREAAVLQNGHALPGHMSFLPRDGAQAKVGAGERGRGVVVMPVTSLSAARTVELRLTSEPGGKTLAQKGIPTP